MLLSHKCMCLPSPLQCLMLEACESYRFQQGVPSGLSSLSPLTCMHSFLHGIFVPACYALCL